jgi:hypothetical protein
MKPHPRIRKTIKWGGAVVTLLLAVVWIGSGWWHLDCWASKSALLINVSGGTLGAMWGPAIDFRTNDGTRWALEKGWRVGSVYAHVGRYSDNGFHLTWWYWGAWSKYQPHLRAVYIPLWVIVSLVFAVTAMGWHVDALARRGTRLNLCPKCNYDRAGIAADAKCPECGCGGAPARL